MVRFGCNPLHSAVYCVPSRYHHRIQPCHFISLPLSLFISLSLPLSHPTSFSYSFLKFPTMSKISFRGKKKKIIPHPFIRFNEHNWQPLCETMCHHIWAIASLFLAVIALSTVLFLQIPLSPPPPLPLVPPPYSVAAPHFTICKHNGGMVHFIFAIKIT